MVSKRRQGPGARPPDRARAAAAIEDFLRALGHPPEGDPQLAETGRLVAEAFAEDLLAGYAMDPAAILTERMPEASSELVLVRDLAASCMCPHHLLPATGVVHVAYVPDGEVVGLGAIGRLVDCFARRLTLQETLVREVAAALMQHLGARGAACAAVLSPACLTARGERRHGASVTSVTTLGVLQDDPVLRAAFVAGLRGAGGGEVSGD